MFFLSGHYELIYGLRRLQQLALEVCCLVSRQGADAREGLLAVIAFGRLVVSVVVVSVVPSELRDPLLLLRCFFLVDWFRRVLHVYL